MEQPAHPSSEKAPVERES